MKTNLDSLFKMDKDLEKDGIWMDVSKDVSFRVRRFGGANGQRLKAAMAKYHKPYARLIETDSLTAEEEAKIMIKTFVSTCLVDWKGVTEVYEENGEEKTRPMPFTFENAVNLFMRLPDLYSSLYQYANDAASYKEDLGNS